MNWTPQTTVAQQHADHSIFWIAAVLVAVAFFVTGHNLHFSKAEGFTESLDEMVEAASGGNTFRRLAFVSLGIMGFCFLFRGSSMPFSLRSSLAGLLAGFIAWSVISTVWSDHPTMTARRVAVMICVVVAALGISKQLSLRDLLKLAIVVPAIYLLLGIGTELVVGTFRPFGSEYRFAGTVHPNTQGVCLAILCLAVWSRCWSNGPRKRLYWALFGIGFCFLLLTKSRTSLAGLLAALAACWLISSNYRHKTLLAAGGVWAGCTVVLVLLLSGVNVAEKLTEAALLGRQEEAASLTGRLPVWTELVTYFESRPLTGHGYESFWTADRIETVSGDLEWEIREAHSAYLDLLLSVGLIGTALLLSAVLMGLWMAACRFASSGNAADGFLFALLIFSLINGVTESGMVMPLFPSFLAVCGLAMLACRQQGQLASTAYSRVNLSSLAGPLEPRELGGRL
jgi:O-antigen ligase